MTIQEVIIELRDNPSMHIGRKSIFCLRAYLYGVSWKNPTISNPLLMNDFQRWITKEYKITTTQSWADIIHFFCEDEQHALEQFFIDFENFITSLDNS
jgi:hypothetical protein